MTRLLAVFLLSLNAHAADFSGKVIGVSDGDTLTVADDSRTQHKVRLFGVDAPEPSQPFGQAAKKHLSDLLVGKDVRVSMKKQDRYGLVFGKVMLQPAGCPTCQHTQDAGLTQLEAGMAWWHREYRRQQTLEEQGYYEYAEFDAKAQRRGLWADPNPIPPWEWRKKTQVVARR